MRIVVALSALALVTGAALAQDRTGLSAGKGIVKVKSNPQITAAPTAGVDVLIDSSAGALRSERAAPRFAHFASLAEAERSCARAAGTFSSAATAPTCRNPRRALTSDEGDIIVTGTRIPQPNHN
jgi:hypothetical protein